MPVLVSGIQQNNDGEGDEATPVSTRRDAAPAHESRFRDLFFGTLAPIEMLIEWNGHSNVVSLRILEADENVQVSTYAWARAQGHPEGDAYLLAQTIARIAFALVAVDGKPISDECHSLDDRLVLAAELPDTLQDSIIDAYGDARMMPIAFLAEMEEDGDSFGAPPTGSGSSPVAVEDRSGG